MTLRLYNTLSRRVEEFRPLEEGRVRMYTCGPTVYDRAHIGNFRTFLFDDVLRRHLKSKGYEVVQVRNLTDVDDRTIKGALRAGVSLREFTEPYVRAFFEDSDTLGIERVEHYPRATDHVAEMIELVGELERRDLAYVADGSVYFDISRFPEYGRLAQLERASIREGARVSGDEVYAKDDARDFVLWKGGERPEEGEVAAWDSPWGVGRPGWHLECSVLAMTFLDVPFDIHTGGVDLIFPHHTNEVAQAEGATGKKFARYWLHYTHILIDGRKMSKSEGNYFTIPDLLERGYRPSAIRRLLTAGHYRAELNFTLDGLDDATRSVDRLLQFRRRLESAGVDDADRPATRLPELADSASSAFGAALDDDLNLSEAWASLFVFVRDANAELDRAGGPVRWEEARAALDTLESIDGVLGVLSLAERESREVPESTRRWVEERLAERSAARESGDFDRADRIREELMEAGVEVEDTPAGARWRLVGQG